MKIEGRPFMSAFGARFRRGFSITGTQSLPLRMCFEVVSCTGQRVLLPRAIPRRLLSDGNE